MTHQLYEHPYVSTFVKTPSQGGNPWSGKSSIIRRPSSTPHTIRPTTVIRLRRRRHDILMTSGAVSSIMAKYIKNESIKNRPGVNVFNATNRTRIPELPRTTAVTKWSRLRMVTGDRHVSTGYQNTSTFRFGSRSMDIHS